MHERLNRNILADLLKGPLPGEAAQIKMAPVFRNNFPLQGKPSVAAVVFLIYESGGELRTVFIRRNEYPGPHSAQVSLPGGMKDPGDDSLAMTAMRELLEETGISGISIEMLGQLTPLHIPVSNIEVHPFVAWGDGQAGFSPDPEEVQYLITPTLRHLFDNNSIEEEDSERDGVVYRIPYFLCGKDKIWGATAMMISELKELICSAQPAPEL